MEYISSSVDLDWWQLIVSVGAGLAIFLYGLLLLTDGLKRAAGSTMKRILGRMTSNRFKGALAGAFITSVIQSSSVTTVLVVGFISAGLMGLTESVGVIMGANIGTTITAQIVAFKVTKAALVLIAIGGIGFVFSSVQKRKNIFLISLALGFIFFGMTLMSDGTAPLRTYAPFIDFMQWIESPLLGILAGALFTAIVQSSSATTAIVIVLATQGLVTLEGGIALAFGANVGTCVTAFLASLGKPVDAKRAALVHVMFNVAGVLIWVGFIDELVLMVHWLTAQAGSEVSVDIAKRVPREIANAHTIFNVLNTVILIGFATPMAKLSRWAIKDQPIKQGSLLEAKYLDDSLISTPALALDRARLEIGRMGERLIEMVGIAGHLISEESEQDSITLRTLDDEVDSLYLQITSYLGRVSSGQMTGEEVKTSQLFLAAASALENLGDQIDLRFGVDFAERSRLMLEFSPQTRNLLKDLILSVIPNLELTLKALDEGDVELAQRIRLSKAQLKSSVEKLRVHLMSRLAESSGERARVFGLETEVVEAAKRLNDISRRIAKLVIARYEAPKG